MVWYTCTTQPTQHGAPHSRLPWNDDRHGMPCVYRVSNPRGRSSNDTDQGMAWSGMHQLWSRFRGLSHSVANNFIKHPGRTQTHRDRLVAVHLL